ncbi:hypothetical protein [Legionella jamestowniensis]|uniref:Uncharacterized protein n=1 Tax=Legionella jamestowniensis TaxID=455 RepID=A0A0W0UKP6_9GAMM|nr:hypothetical protein [Legionella jamestowniensis]KTD08481.1 hypothetical protein Ljam_2676 [Legionella jamestowniensis]OCH97053.1 hypothetical protein A8135_05320 [Legionella jamestowniensis]SFL51720.1 hypothetical protein SAMN02746073_0618 [Legionella jamestowniensis DSM 19215]
MFDMIVDKSDEFYIAIAKNEEGHSFIFAGVKSNGENHLLARVGKVKVDDDSACQFILKFGFSSIQSKLEDEKIYRNKGKRYAINYIAYTISYEQYLSFIGLLQQIQEEKRRSFQCYKPIEENDSKVKLQLTAEKTELTYQIEPKPRAKEIIEHTETLHCTNTCRHSALALVNYVFDSEQATQDVSKQFFHDLPFHTTLVANDGVGFVEYVRKKAVTRQFVHPDNTIPFYILPAPPSSFKNLDPLKRKVMTELYHQLEKMVHISPELQKTAHKFSILKALYNEKMGINEESLSDFINSISMWKSIHRDELKTLRKTYFFDSFFTRETATEKMFSRFEEYFAKTALNP